MTTQVDPNRADAQDSSSPKAGSNQVAALGEELWDGVPLKQAMRDAVSRSQVGFNYDEFTKLIKKDDEVGDEEDLQSIDESVNLLLHMFAYYNNTDRLLDTLPATIRIDESDCWLTLNKIRSGYQAGYLHGDGVYERSLNVTAETPTEALQQLSQRVSKALGGHDV